ncbi:acyltransferase [Lentibacillus saliphilus]|uniref:acyltransferase n=1 Tax=Lentibacillus saliphilus TaxID=2737028 RepID=UPI001FE85694|nr:acyltransferase [Lentibacillus saliphilus]
MRGREKFNRYKKVISFLVIVFSILPYRIRVKIFDSLRMLSGKKGLLLRYISLKSLAKDCGDNVSIHQNVYIFGLENLCLGDNVSIHPFCYIDATGTIEIGSDVSVAHATTIMSTEHKYEDKSINIKDQGTKKIKTCIKSNVWIGSGCRILAGSVINEGTILAAGAVVKKQVPKNSIYGGIPAKLIKER